jgi:gamma-glutamyltranspeptidase / glutathione hydrolase
VQEEDDRTGHEPCDATALMAFRTAPSRPPAVAAEAMVATSQPLATRAGLRALERGGNAVDAALAAAAVLCVTEPMSTGIGGDAFALVWDGERLHGLDAAGPAPREAEPLDPVAERGPRSVTVPGAVAGWAALAERFGRLGLDTVLADAIGAAEEGFAVGRVTAEAWARSDAPAELGPVPRLGDRVRLSELGATLRRVAAEGPDALYRGEAARAIAASTWLAEEDLAAYEPRWVDPLSLDYRGTSVCELPPPTQGVAALEGLGLLALGEPGLAAQVECVRLALEDTRARVRDGADVADLLEPSFLARRRAGLAAPVSEPAGGTVYLCAVDGDRMAVSFIQSLYDGFGSGVVAPGTSVVLQNRGAGFSVSGRVEPGRRPYHTLIPGLLLRGGSLLGPFGVMGGFLQAQAHVQLVSALVDDGLDPQAALDRPRFRVQGEEVLLEEGLWERAGELEAAGLRPVPSSDRWLFGGGQAILVEGEVLAGGSDARKDGYAAGF